MKRLFAFILALLMMTVFVGCDTDDGTKATADEAPTQVETVQTEFTLMLNAFTCNDIEYMFTVDDLNSGVDGKKINNISFVVHTGDTVADALSASGYKNFVVDEVHDEFLGFVEYKVVTDDDSTTVTYEKVSDDIYSVKELMNREITDYSVTYVAKWKNLSDDYYAAHGY